MSQQSAQSYRILVVDYEYSVCQALAMGLASEEFVVDTALDGASALHSACKGVYDVLVVDLSLPDIDGLEVIRRVKDLHPETVSILISSYSTKETILEAMRTEVSDFFEKPFQLATIKKSINRCLERREMKSDMVDGSTPPDQSIQSREDNFVQCHSEQKLLPESIEKGGDLVRGIAFRKGPKPED